MVFKEISHKTLILRTNVKFLRFTGYNSGSFNGVSPWYSVNYDLISKLISVTVQPGPGDTNDDRLVDFHDFQMPLILRW